jgi:serine phosphatase RsbU (regulator of sigma subunit)
MSSIQYAQNIQQAILPTKNTMKDLFEESFVLFIPKDIVSGDFYWTTQVRKRIKLRNTAGDGAGDMLPGFQVFTFLAVVDCTGHGVPGAFMSMIGNSLLNEIVNNQKKYSPARILQLMHEGIRTRLMQEETSNRDGMDVCLCRLEYRDDDKIELTFSGAKRPVFLVRNGEVTKIPGGMESIGGWLEGMQRNYENKTVELEKNDTLYLSSDGFVDSASPKRKKFGEKRFRQMIAENGHLPMNEQHQIVVKALANHQLDTEQRDDITIVGVKV